MAENLKLLGSRRAYEFAADHLRLSVLSTQEVTDLIRSEFRFQVAAYGTPGPTFGPVPATVPAGLVFNTGSWQTDDDRVVPIRFLHFESQRIVIDVAGPSATIAPIFDHIRQITALLTTLEIGSTIGEPERVLEYSEYTLVYSNPPTSLLAPHFRDLVQGVLGRNDGMSALATMPTLLLSFVPNGQSFEGVNLADGRSLQFGPRKGTRPDDHTYFSAAPLDSEVHAAYLAGL